jgi:ribosomal protein S18 acetylase RimI-like enzyme
VTISASHQIIQLSVEEVDRVEHLWKGMVAHHREVAEGEWPVASEGDAWRRRRREYLEWLAGEEPGEEAWMLAAVRSDDLGGRPDGYALVITRGSGATWEMGEKVGELESLAVAAGVRGQGIGTMLIDAARELMRAEGVAYWGVAVVEANAEATALYERAGFRPYYRNLLGEVD